MSRYGYSYGYTYRGGPLISQWGRGVPVQTRAADSVAMGSLQGSSLDGNVLLPAPGAPEPIGVAAPTVAMGGCGCSGQCGCGDSGDGLSGFVDSIPGGYLTLGAAAVAAWYFLTKRRR